MTDRAYYQQQLDRFERHNKVRRLMVNHAHHALPDVDRAQLTSLVTALMTAQIESFGYTKQMSDSQLLAVRGIGEGRLQLIRRIEESFNGQA